MNAQQVVWHSEGRTEAVQRREKELWLMTRRICFVNATTMGGYKGSEEGLWNIDGDVKKEPKDIKKNIDEWRERLIELGKWKKQNS
jgi:hypothetical protein